MTARRLENLREFFHFLKFGENGDDFPLLPQETVAPDGVDMETLLAKYDLDAQYVAKLVLCVHPGLSHSSCSVTAQNRAGSHLRWTT